METAVSSLVSPELVSQFNQVFLNLATNDNDLRTTAEKQLNEQWLAQQPNFLLLSLTQLGRTHDKIEGRAFAFVLLRRIAFRQVQNQTVKIDGVTVWDSIPSQSMEAIKHDLLIALSIEQENTVRHKWDQLLPALFEASKSLSVEHREAALRIFSAVPTLITDQPIEIVKQVFSENLQVVDNPEIRMATLKASVAFVLETDQQNRSSFAELMPQMLDVLFPLVTKHDGDGLIDGIMVFIELGESLPRIFRPVLSSVISFSVSIMKDKSFEDNTRQTALELLLTLSETSPSMMRKSPDFCTQVIPIALEMMTDLVDIDSWHTTDDLEDSDNDENYVVGEHAMDRLARNLGGKAVLPIAFQYIPSMLGSESWEQRHAALMAISAIGEGCVKIMEAELGKIIELVLPYLRDQNSRVRYAACNAIGQMSTDFQDTLQRKYHQLVLTNLIPVMDAPEARLLVLLNSGRTYVQEQAITTIATVADSSEDRFVKKEYRLLRGKAMECATLAVGKEIFLQNAPEFIQLLTMIQQSVTEPDDPQVSYLIASWARVCKVLGPDFVPYLPTVMPPLLQSAQLKPDFAILDPDEDIENKYSIEDGWEFVGVEGQQIGIKTTVLEEKCTAVEMLICYARELGPAFCPYVEQVLEIVLPLLKFLFHEGVRNAAAATIPHLLQAVKKANASPEYILNMWHTIAKKIIECIMIETDTSFLWQLYVTFHESLEVVGDNSLDEQLLNVFTKATEAQLQEFYRRLQQREQARHSGDYDADDEDLIMEEEATEEGVLGELSKALHVILKTHRTAYLSSFDNLLPVVKMFLADANSSARQWALCVIDDVIEFTGPASWNYHAHFLEKMIASLMDIAPDVRQAAAYGIGVCAQFGGENYTDAIAASLNPLFQIINIEDSRKDENVYATENAISAITKILKFNNTKIDVNTVLPSWFASLPILYDEEEAALTYSYLLDLLEAQHPAILGNNNANLPHIVNIFIDVLAAEILPEDTATRMVSALKVILNSFTEEYKTTLWNSIDPDKQMTLQNLNKLEPNITVHVGGKDEKTGLPTLSFRPQNVTVVKGDTIVWVFDGGNHNVVQSDGPDGSCELSTAPDACK
ncbi:14994_t:CDS:10 [Entrophospora sp. SA101]|nr:14994_t:CDS:10 [Entrophospora sp. SA101]